jgi:regulator of sigma E protease
MSWLLAIGGIIALIVLHELGHFAVAKALGMRVERFSLFFPPTIARIRRGETEYAIGAIPAGGYVKITGMNPDEVATLEPDVARRAYYNQPPWKRIAVILAGPGVNILIAFILFWAVLVAGNLHGEVALSNLTQSARPIGSSTRVAIVQPGMPADGKLHRGDVIVAIDGRHVREGEAARALIDTHRCAGRPVAGCGATTPAVVTVKRGGALRTVDVYPRYSSEAGRVLLGVGFADASKHFGAISAAGAALSSMWDVTTQTLTNFGKALTQSKVRHELHSIIGISQVSQESVAAGTGYAIVFLGFLSLILAVINLFPFLPLDGGHVLWALAEKVKGGRVSLMAMYRFSSVGIVLLLFLVVNGVGNDISRLTG